MSDGATARRIAIDALERIDRDNAFANLVLPKVLEESDLDQRDRGFVTELVYGTTRRFRSMDFAVDRFIDRDDVDPRTRAALRAGAYQLLEMRVPAHAAVDATVAAAPKRSRGFVNAILRKVSAGGDVDWPTEAHRLSYPNWIVSRLEEDLGDRAIPVLEAMNGAATTHTRADGFRQDLASQEVAKLIVSAGLVLDLCAAPGGKATLIASGGATVLASDLHPHRAGLVRTAAAETQSDVHPLVADATHPPFRAAMADAVLIDAPCSGLGSLRRRPDARWRIKHGDVAELAALQFELIETAEELLKPGGQLVFSVCTLTTEESTAVDARVADALPQLEPIPLGKPWEPFGRGGRLLPDRFEGDGMAAFSYRKRSSGLVVA